MNSLKMIISKKLQAFCVLVMVSLLLNACKRSNKSTLIQVPSTQYIIEYYEDSIAIIFEQPNAMGKTISLFLKDGQYYSCIDSSLFLTNKDNSITIVYDTLNHKKIVRTFQELYKDSIYVTENYNVPYDSLNYDYYSLKERDSVMREIFYYYDKDFKMVKIHRYNDIDYYEPE